MLLVVVILVLATIGTAACTSSGGGAAASVSGQGKVPVGQSTQTLSVDGTTRTVHLYRPGHLSGSVPLVVMLHGGFGSGVQAENSYHWDPQAESGHFVVAFPDGLNASWNAGGGCCGPSAKAATDDVAFLRQVVAKVRTELPIDPRRIYISGVSNGGVMAYRMACETDLFAAVGVVSATMLVNCDHAVPTSILHIHGTADPIVPYGGGPGEPYSPNSPPIDGPPVPSVTAMWRSIDHCAGPKVSTSGKVTTSAANCSEDKTVELITIAGAGHGWPGGVPNPRAERYLHTGPPSSALNATQSIWRFFAAHPG